MGKAKTRKAPKGAKTAAKSGGSATTALEEQVKLAVLKVSAWIVVATVTTWQLATDDATQRKIAISNIIAAFDENPLVLAIFVANNGIELVADRVLDDDAGVRVEACGCLRYVCTTWLRVVLCLVG